MTLLHMVTLAFIQGITEFLPISSSAHLILVPYLTGWNDQGLNIDVAVHLGTLGAVIIYFHREITAIIKGMIQTFKGKHSPESKLGFYLILSTIPIICAGFLFEKWHLMETLRTPQIIAWATIIFGIILWISDRFGMTLRRLDHINAFCALFIGMAQVLSLIPGTSRSGITITALRFLGFERLDSAKYAMLLSIPVILAAGTLTSYELIVEKNFELNHQFFMAIILSFMVALTTLKIFMGWLQKSNLTPFVIYRLILGVGLLAWIYI